MMYLLFLQAAVWMLVLMARVLFVKWPLRGSFTPVDEDEECYTRKPRFIWRMRWMVVTAGTDMVGSSGRRDTSTAPSHGHRCCVYARGPWPEGGASRALIGFCRLELVETRHQRAICASVTRFDGGFQVSQRVHTHCFFFPLPSPASRLMMMMTAH